RTNGCYLSDPKVCRPSGNASTIFRLSRCLYSMKCCITYWPGYRMFFKGRISLLISFRNAGLGYASIVVYE
ncbi:hypothetical protein L9F63_023113, partial [Diploptera punctata]